jgi:phosphoribosylamine--glycine ligase
VELPVRVLVVGSGAREHALCALLGGVAEVWSTRAHRTLCSPATPLGIDPLDVPAVVAAARQIAAQLVVVGPEQPLAAGLVDALQAAGIAALGPAASSARLETSKAFGKAFCQRHGIPTAGWASFDGAAAAWAWARSRPQPPVVKGDGLAAGKGVVVPATPEACRAAITTLLAQHGRVVLEDRLHGSELSVFALVRDGAWCMLPPCRDYKRARDGDDGPMTGGMGAVCPAPGVSSRLMARIAREVIGPAVRGLVAEGLAYRGVLFAGLMLTAAGPRVLEFNVRFGDPELQALAAAVGQPLAHALLATGLSSPVGALPAGLTAALQAVTVVLAAEGYPAVPRLGDPIEGWPSVTAAPAVSFACGGVGLHDGRAVTAAGRVLSVTAIAPQRAVARALAYDAAHHIHWQGRWMRAGVAGPSQRGPAKQTAAP